MLSPSLGRADAKATVHELLGLPFGAHEMRLENDMRVVCVPWRRQQALSFYTLVTVGSRNETDPGKSGFAHLFEHMMFRGSKRFPAERYEGIMQSIGADNNAYTTRDYTLYTVSVSKEQLDTLLEIEADRFQYLHYAPSAFKTETGAVLGEYHTASSDPWQTLWEKLSEISYSKHPYQHTTLGYVDDIKAMPGLYDYSLEFFQTHYLPRNTVVLVVGDIDPAQWFSKIQKHYLGWKNPSVENNLRQIVPETPPPRGQTTSVNWPNEKTNRVLIGYRVPGFFKSPSATSADRHSIRELAALEVLRILLFGPQSSLVQELVIDQQKLLALESWGDFMSRDAGLFVIEAEFSPDSFSFDELDTRIQRQIDALQLSPPSSIQISRIVSHLLNQKALSMQRPGDLAEELASFMARTGTLEGRNRFMQALQRTTAKHVKEVARRYLSPSRRFQAQLSNETK
ncbi:MAG: insulinase family protein [Myxococcales bacterium]|nr:MAG: insulinase family protein [Myxococcales bacterium]